MCSFSCSDIQLGLNTVGLLSDIAGAWLVAWEVVSQYKGKLTEVTKDTWKETTIENTKDFSEWESKKYNLMKWGLGFLTLGFLLQLASNWILKFNSIMEFCSIPQT